MTERTREPGPLGVSLTAPIRCQYVYVRIVGSVSLAGAATLLGLLGNFMLALTGLSLAGPGLTMIEYSDSDDAERSIGVVIGTIALVAWLMLLLSAALVGLRGRPTRARRATAWIVVGLSAIFVLGTLIAVLATPPPPSDYPLPEWNRA